MSCRSGKSKPMLQHGVAVADRGRMVSERVVHALLRAAVHGVVVLDLCNCPGNSQTANQILGNVAKVGNGVGGNAYFNPLAYAPVTTVAFGTSGFDQLFGPGATNLDMNIFRDFRITERFHIQARAEVV